MLVLVGAYVLILTAAVLWAFEVKLQRWPTVIYGAPYTVRVGADLKNIRLFERLSRLGYVRTPVLAPDPGHWSLSGPSLDVYLKHFPLQGQGIVSGPVHFTLDIGKIRSIHLTRSLENVDRIILEPELISIVPASGWDPHLTRPVRLETVPPLLVDAIVLTEDRRFYTHPGIDVGSIVRAFKANLKAWRYVQGGSTITQQLIRMTLLTSKKTLVRKANEIALALTAELLYSKRTILEAYLNRVYFGHWGSYPLHGVETAANQFFGKALKQLDPAECAFMAASIRAPNIITPRRHPERAKSRRNMILGLLFKEGKISRDDYEQAVASPVKIRRPGAPPVRAPAFLHLLGEVASTEVNGWGKEHHDVLTSLDPVLQNDANLQLKRLGRPGLSTHLILSSPDTGDLRAFVAPHPSRWDGKGGSLRSLLPMVILPGLMPDKRTPARFTLTSQVFTQDGSKGPITFREAFRTQRVPLIRKLTDTVGIEKIAQVLNDFDIQTRSESNGTLAVGPVTPLQMAQSYSLLALGGRAPTIGPGIRILNGLETVFPRENKRVSIPGSCIFLVNHLMKGLQPPEQRHRGPDRPWLRPSIFLEQDSQGIWGVAYRRDALLLVRLPGTHVAKSTVLSMMLKILPSPALESEKPHPVPDGVVFRNICVDSGLRATSICPDVVREPFLRGSEPVEWCPLRHESHPVRSQKR